MAKGQLGSIRRASAGSDPSRSHWIWIFGAIDGLRWVLKHGHMAFAEHAGARVRGMKAGDLACLYVTRGAFSNPTRDEARLAGLVEITSDPRATAPVVIAEREFSLLVDFTPLRVFPERTGPSAREVVSRLSFVKRPEVWGQYLRVGPIKVTERDYRMLEAAVLAWSRAKE